MLVDGLGQRPGTARILGVRLHAGQQRRQRLPGRLLRRLLVDAELAGQLAHRDLAEEIVDSGHGILQNIDRTLPHPTPGDRHPRTAETRMAQLSSET
jgi:hypothetical protein